MEVLEVLEALEVLEFQVEVELAMMLPRSTPTRSLMENMKVLSCSHLNPFWIHNGD